MSRSIKLQRSSHLILFLTRSSLSLSLSACEDCKRNWWPGKLLQKLRTPIVSPLRTIRWGILCGSTLEIGRFDNHQQSWIINGTAHSRSHARFPLTPSGWNFMARCRYILFFMCPYLSQQHRIRFQDNNHHHLLRWKSMGSKNGLWIPFSILECIEDDYSTLLNGPDLITRIGSQRKMSTS